MLATQSIQLSTRGELTAKGGDPSDFGLTNPPSNFQAPTFNIVPMQKKGFGWSARLQILQPADEGVNSAYHLGPGTYSIGFMFSNGGLTQYAPGVGNRSIHVEVSQGLSDDSRDAEQEHCADAIHAYGITLGAVQDALERVRNNNPYQWHDKRDKAVRAVRNDIVNGLHPRLAKIVRDAVNDQGFVNAGQFATQLGALYLAVWGMSQNRDNQGWHFLQPDRRGESWSAWSWAEWAKAKAAQSKYIGPYVGELKDIRTLMRGPQFSVNVTASPAVVFL